jgi:hypothetical protein
MRPALDERAAPDPVSGAVSFHPDPPVSFHPDPPVSFHPDPPRAHPTLGERDFWRAVGATVLATLRPWLR